MRAQNHIPGPKAHHALIISYVKGGNPRGALLAIRQAHAKSKFRHVASLQLVDGINYRCGNSYYIQIVVNNILPKNDIYLC